MHKDTYWGLAANSDGTIRNVYIRTTVIYYYDTIQGGLVGHCTGIVEDCSVNAIIGPKELTFIASVCGWY